MRAGGEWLLFAVLLLLALIARHPLQGSEADLRVYQSAALSLEKGELPSVSFRSEYPPLASLLFTAPRLLGTDWVPGFQYYRWAFMIEAAGAAAVGMVAVKRSAWQLGYEPDRVGRVYQFTIVALFPVVLHRYDIFPVVATAFALAGLLEDRPVAAGGWLGIGIGLKLYPVVLLPLFLVDRVVQRRGRAAAVVLLAALAAVTIPLLPYVLLRSSAFLHFLQYHRKRGLQIESSSGAAILLAAILHLTRVKVIYNFGAHHLDGRWPTAVLRVQGALAVGLLSTAALIAILSLTRSGREEKRVRARVLVTGCTAVVLAFILANKVFSPQYLLWLVPLLALQRRWQAGLFLAIAAASTFLFVYCYFALVRQHPAEIIAWNVRNGALAVLLVNLLGELASGRWRSRRPAMLVRSVEASD